MGMKETTAKTKALLKYQTNPMGDLLHMGWGVWFCECGATHHKAKNLFLSCVGYSQSSIIWRLRLSEWEMK